MFSDEVYLIYELCAYDNYIYHQISFWCDLLTDDDRDVLEYGQDLEVMLIFKVSSILNYVYSTKRLFMTLSPSACYFVITGNSGATCTKINTTSIMRSVLLNTMSPSGTSNHRTKVKVTG